VLLPAGGIPPMTTDQLRRAIADAEAWHRHQAHQPEADHLVPGTPCRVTLDEVAAMAGVKRRVVEAAVQQARLEGIPVLTDGGVRIATTAAEAHALARWLLARMKTQQETHAAVLSAAQLMARAEEAQARETAAASTYPPLGPTPPSLWSSHG
jgi:hypothetical protein